MGVGDILSGVVASSIQSVEVRSNATPPGKWAPTPSGSEGGGAPAEGGSGGGSSGGGMSAGRFLRPWVRVTLADGTPIDIAPYGRPIPGVWIFSVGGIAFLGWMVIEGFRRGVRAVVKA